jgi:hypothetical protein
VTPSAPGPLLENLARRLEDQHPGAAASLREGLDETLAVMRLGLPHRLKRVLSSTNLIENPFSRVREIGRRVRRWQSGLRCCAGALRAYSKPSAASVKLPATVRGYRYDLQQFLPGSAKLKALFSVARSSRSQLCHLLSLCILTYTFCYCQRESMFIDAVTGTG